MESPFDSYVSALDAVPMFSDSSGASAPIKHLLWGDGVVFLDAAPTAGKRHVRARGTTGWVKEQDLGGKPLLELYFIDVGQGDGVLVRTPDFRHILIDGGFPRLRQPSLTSAADFIDWKFFKEYGKNTIALDAMIVSHIDQDHYGGLDDLLKLSQGEKLGLDAEAVTIENFYHPGLAWWRGENGARTLGPLAHENDAQYFVQLLQDRASAQAALDGASVPQLQGEWAKFIAKAVQIQTAQGQPTPINRISQHTGTLPEFGRLQPGDVHIEVLGPLEYAVNGQPALKKLGADSISTNGHSVVLRMEYGSARFVLTGDLNKAAHDELLNHYAGNEGIFECDVSKSCHHGSEDVSFKFLKTMCPGATIISSGDAEGHDHPRPRIVAASGLTGHVTMDGDKLLTPLVYSTEIARSLLLGKVERLELPDGSQLVDAGLNNCTVHYKMHKPSGIRPENGKRWLRNSFVVAGLVYGLVNVRTDGKTILCATLSEAKDKGEWNIKTFQSRFPSPL